MSIFAQIAVALIALIHVAIVVIEMAFWDKPLGMRVFRSAPDFAKSTKTMAGNQGLYNGFLVAGLIWALVPIGAAMAAQAIATFFLLCVLAAGLYGALTVSRRILYVQALPALVALLLVWMVPA